MDDPITELARQLLESGVTCLSDRERRIIQHIAKRVHVAQDVNRVLAEEPRSVSSLQTV
jgi:hypothetical protein